MDARCDAPVCRTQARPWHPQLAVDGALRGCIERRDAERLPYLLPNGTCEFDGRLSLVQHRGRLWLYARSNPAVHGQRFAQVASSADGGRSWSPFEFLRLGGYRYAEGDLYFFVASPNPAVPHTLLGLFPLAHRFRGCIGVAASADGVHWSEPAPLLRCAVHGERAVHHPAQGLTLQGGEVSLWVHENVPGVTTDDPNVKVAQHTYLTLPRTRLVRHSVPVGQLRAWALKALEGLRRRVGPSRRSPRGSPGPNHILTANHLR